MPPNMLGLLRLLVAFNLLALAALGDGAGARLPAEQPEARARAFTALYDAQLRPLRAYLRARLPDEVTADDAAAEVFARAWAKLDLAAPPEAAVSWLFTAARHLAIDHHRRARATLPLDAVPAEQQPLTTTPEQSVARSEQVALVRAAVAGLDCREQHVLGLRFAAGMRHREIARRVGTSEGNAAKILHRALQKLRQRVVSDLTHAQE